MYFKRIDGKYTSPTCDACANKGHVKFTNDNYGVPCQDKPWVWGPRKFWEHSDLAIPPCSVCGRSQ